MPNTHSKSNIITHILLHTDTHFKSEYHIKHTNSRVFCQTHSNIIQTLFHSIQSKHKKETEIKKIINTNQHTQIFSKVLSNTNSINTLIIHTSLRHTFFQTLYFIPNLSYKYSHNTIYFKHTKITF